MAPGSEPGATAGARSVCSAPVTSPADLNWLRRAIALARKGLFQVEPNPPVGCVLVSPQAGVVGEGWHAAYGGPHAEVAALAAAGARARGSTAYVSLVPCSRTGKTAPCTQALTRAGIARVLYAASDPLEPADGSGLKELEAAGIAVQGPLLAEEAEPLLVPWRAALARPRPWVVLKWAMGISGHIAPAAGVGGRVSGPKAQRWLHDLRAHVDAVAVGSETVLVDDPRLTCRLVGGPPHGRGQPLRVVFDGRLRLPDSARVWQDLRQAKLVVVTDARQQGARVESLKARGAQVICVPSDEAGLDLKAALEALHALGVRRLLVEGGARLLGSLVRWGLADQVSVLVAPRLFGGAQAVSAVSDTGIESLETALDLQDVVWRRLGDDLLLQGFVPPRPAEHCASRPPPRQGR